MKSSSDGRVLVDDGLEGYNMTGRYPRKSGVHYFHEFSNVARHAAVIETPFMTYACQEPLSEG